MDFFALLSLLLILIFLICLIIFYIVKIVYSKTPQQNYHQIIDIETPTYQNDLNKILEEVKKTDDGFALDYEQENSIYSYIEDYPKRRSISPLKVLPKDLDEYAEQIDYFIRHREDFHPIGFYYNVKKLEEQLPPPKEFKLGSQSKKLGPELNPSPKFIQFLKSRPEFHLRSDHRAIKLTRLTPFRIEGIRVVGLFRCVHPPCRYRWTSFYSFTDHFQICPKCKRRVYPFEQITFEEMNEDSSVYERLNLKLEIISPKKEYVDGSNQFSFQTPTQNNTNSSNNETHLIHKQHLPNEILGFPSKNTAKRSHDHEYKNIYNIDYVSD